MQNSVQDLLARCCTAKGTYLTAKKFAELDGARNCVTSNGHVSRSDNQENNCVLPADYWSVSGTLKREFSLFHIARPYARASESYFPPDYQDLEKIARSISKAAAASPVWRHVSP
jgi:hypothetical protein